VSDEYSGWDVEKLQAMKEWVTTLALSLNNCLIWADIEPIDIKVPDTPILMNNNKGGEG